MLGDDLAPVALFVYDRPDHTRRTVEALRANTLASKTDLIIFSDAARHDASRSVVSSVRSYVRTITGFRTLEIVERTENLGLARSIISGVSSVLDRSTTVIVMEDDLVTAPSFLAYLNWGLLTYRDDDRVASIHGYMYPHHMELPDTFFLRGADCWGWATWRRAWAHFEPNGSLLLQSLERQGLANDFDMFGARKLMQMLRDQVTGRNDSWAVRWHASTFLKGMLTLYPSASLVHNIGNDSSGRHSETTSAFDVPLPSTGPPHYRIPICESAEGTTAVREFFKNTQKDNRGGLVRIARANLRRLWH
jgi:hypothetical protein